MRLADVCRDDLLPLAAVLAQEVELCAAMADELQGQWNNETNALLCCTLAGGIAQILQLQRACLIESLNTEGVVYVSSIDAQPETTQTA